MSSDSGQPLIRYRLLLLFSLILSLTHYSRLTTVQDWLIQGQGSKISDLIGGLEDVGWIIFEFYCFRRQFLEKWITGREEPVQTILLYIAIDVLLEIIYGLGVANFL